MSFDGMRRPSFSQANVQIAGASELMSAPNTLVVPVCALVPTPDGGHGMYVSVSGASPFLFIPVTLVERGAALEGAPVRDDGEEVARVTHSGQVPYSEFDVCEQPALARRIAAAQPEFSPRSVVVTTFERDNAAKHAVSKLRASCGGTALKGNHVKAPMAGSSSNSSVTTTTSRMYIDPRLFLAEASQSLIGRRRMRDGVKQTLGQPRFELHYEDLQQSPSAAIGSMLRAIGVHRFDRAALGKSGLVKGSSDDLRRCSMPYA